MSELSQLLYLINTYWGYIVFALGVLGIGIDMSPMIKINPVRFIIGKFGELLNSGIYKKVDDLETELKGIKKDIDDTQKKIDDNRRKELRRYILDFANSLTKRTRSKEEYDDIYAANKEYHLLLEKYGWDNGKLDRAMKTIDRHWKSEDEKDWADEDE